MLAAELKRQTATLGCEIKFSLLNGDQRKPIILLTSTGGKNLNGSTALILFA